MSHNYIDIGTVEVDACTSARRAQVDAIQTINSDEVTALMWFAWHEAATSDLSPSFKNQFLLDGRSD